MVLGSMSYSGVEVMTVIDKIMTKEVCVRLLKENLNKSLKKAGLGRRYIFKQVVLPEIFSYCVKVSHSMLII